MAPQNSKSKFSYFGWQLVGFANGFVLIRKPIELNHHHLKSSIDRLCPNSPSACLLRSRFCRVRRPRRDAASGPLLRQDAKCKLVHWSSARLFLPLPVGTDLDSLSPGYIGPRPVPSQLAPVAAAAAPAAAAAAAANALTRWQEGQQETIAGEVMAADVNRLAAETNWH